MIEKIKKENKNNVVNYTLFLFFFFIFSNNSCRKDHFSVLILKFGKFYYLLLIQVLLLKIRRTLTGLSLWFAFTSVFDQNRINCVFILSGLNTLCVCKTPCLWCIIPRLNKKMTALTKRSLFMFIFLISDFGKISLQPHLYYAYINNSFFKLTICVK